MASLLQLAQEKKCKILAVEDDMFSMAFLQAQIESLGHEIIKATNGREAITMLKAHYDEIDVVVMDREMPIMDGITAVRHIKQDAALRKVPIIMVTAADAPEEMQQGLDAGVFYYITKPVHENVLSSVLSAALRDVAQMRILSSELGQHKASFQMMKTAKFEFQTLEAAESLASFMANCFPEPSRVVSGLGNLLINAIEHGNLGIGYEQKGKLLASGLWRSEINKLQQSSTHRDKIATATIAVKEQGIYVVIEDQGDGFEWRKYMSIDPSRASDSHGRGIAQAYALSFDKLTYNEKGTQAVALVSHEAQLQW
jgi:CheY-like chemotaxis protein